jgi:uncharacterized protein (TIGR03435 family)
MWLNMAGVKPQLLMQLAYNLKGHQILGLPPWANSDVYYVRQETGVAGNIEQRRLLLRAMLADRFQLRLHRETRNMRMYRLVRAESGLKITPALAYCMTPDDFRREDARRQNLIARGKDPGDPPLAEINVCGTFRERILRSGLLRLDGFAVTIPQLVEYLSDEIGDTVIDKTGLAGTFDLSLDYFPDALGSLTIFIALSEQLGLRLEATEGPVEVLVVDHLERPAAK